MAGSNRVLIHEIGGTVVTFWPARRAKHSCEINISEQLTDWPNTYHIYGRKLDDHGTSSQRSRIGIAVNMSPREGRLYRF